MKKKALSIFLSILLVMSFMAGCSKNLNSKETVNPDPTKDAKASETPVATETVKGVTISYAVWDSNQAKLIQQLADAFETETGIHVDIQVNGWSDYWTALEAAATGGSLPDTFWMHSNNIYYYASNGQLLDLTDEINSSSDIKLENYPAGLNQIYNLEGRQYAIPKDYDTIGLWYNKTMFDAAGVAYPNGDWTWEDLKAAAEKLTKKDGSQYGILAPLHNQEGYYNFVYQNGGTIVTPDKKSGYDDPKTIDAIKYYFDFVRNGLSPVITGDAERAEAFQNGLTAMAFFGSWNLSGFAANEYIAKNCDVAVLPKSNNGGQASIFNGLGNCIAATTEHPKEAWKWLEYLSNEAGQKKQAELGIAISAYNGTADAWTKAYPGFQVQAYLDMVTYAQIRPYTNQTSLWEDKAYELLTNVYANGGDVEAACKEVAAMMNNAIEHEQK
ncbi:sugar ABC transporter substrate-binding protein [Anaerocolumna sp. AGMB13020]|uniref:ABC transporter substrate-binding protein n=1 Tax=Anaerocolumna sp. AGMB13020 TaxID=3081750 RepID=UPI0029543F3C|nr:sugar ABC transporter substrate-binding protein [Anaerocolumna sp. AGMB13020]WOO38241.1 sugar ABC transporter substrate-binding protein [Anaerocolumna sp. AGMB13020]